MLCRSFASYITMSRRPGLGKGWFEKFKDDVYPDDFVVLIDGSKHSVPTFYDKQLPEKELRLYKRDRIVSAKRHADNNTPDRLAVREEIQLSRVDRLRGSLMSRRSNFVFSKVPQADIPRSSFDRSFQHKTTFDAGYLVPVFVDEALPGDTFNVSMTAFARLATPLHPFMDNLYLDSFSLRFLFV